MAGPASEKGCSHLSLCYWKFPINFSEICTSWGSALTWQRFKVHLYNLPFPTCPSKTEKTYRSITKAELFILPLSLSPSSPAYWQSTCPASQGQRPDCFPLAASSWCLSPQVTRSGLVGKPVWGQPACSRERRPSSLTRPRLAQPYSTLLPLRCPGALLRATWQGFLSREKLTLLRFLLFGEWLTLVGLQGALLLSSTSVGQSQTSAMCVLVLSCISSCIMLSLH